MKGEIAIVIAVTQQEWAGRLNRWISDHGGYVRLRDHYAFTRDDALGQDYDCLVSDADSSLLDSALVLELHRLGRTVVGVCDPALPHTRARLERLGVDRVMDKTASPPQMLAVISDVTRDRQQFNTVLKESLSGEPHLPDHGTAVSEAARSCMTVVTGPAEGQGATEVAIETAVQLRRRGETVTLVDADLVAPNLAQRLRLPFYANLNVAVDAVVHGSGELAEALVTSATGGFDVLAGFEHPKKWVDLDAGELLEMLEELRGLRSHVLVNVGSQLEDLAVGRHQVARALVAAADRVVVVAESSPTGAERLTRWLVDAAELTDFSRIYVAFNRSPSREAHDQLAAELHRCARVAGVWRLPEDRKVARAAWAGGVVRPGRFAWAVAKLVAEALPRTASDAMPDGNLVSRVSR